MTVPGSRSSSSLMLCRSDRMILCYRVKSGGVSTAPSSRMKNTNCQNWEHAALKKAKRPTVRWNGDTICLLLGNVSCESVLGYSKTLFCSYKSAPVFSQIARTHERVNVFYLCLCSSLVINKLSWTHTLLLSRWNGIFREICWASVWTCCSTRWLRFIVSLCFILCHIH